MPRQGRRTRPNSSRLVRISIADLGRVRRQQEASSRVSGAPASRLIGAATSTRSSGRCRQPRATQPFVQNPTVHRMEKIAGSSEQPRSTSDNLGSCNHADCHDFSSKAEVGHLLLVIRAGIIFMVRCRCRVPRIRCANARSPRSAARLRVFPTVPFTVPGSRAACAMALSGPDNPEFSLAGTLYRSPLRVDHFLTQPFISSTRLEISTRAEQLCRQFLRSQRRVEPELARLVEDRIHGWCRRTTKRWWR